MGTETSFEEIYRVLSESRRRAVLRELQKLQEGEIITKAEAAERVKEIEGKEDYRSPRVTLHQIHLPLLEDAGFIEWDRESGVIRRGPKYHLVEDAPGVSVEYSFSGDDFYGDWGRSSEESLLYKLVG